MKASTSLRMDLPLAEPTSSLLGRSGCCCNVTCVGACDCSLVGCCGLASGEPCPRRLPRKDDIALSVSPSLTVAAAHLRSAVHTLTTRRRQHASTAARIHSADTVRDRVTLYDRGALTSSSVVRTDRSDFDTELERVAASSCVSDVRLLLRCCVGCCSVSSPFGWLVELSWMDQLRIEYECWLIWRLAEHGRLTCAAPFKASQQPASSSTQHSTAQNRKRTHSDSTTEQNRRTRTGAQNRTRSRLVQSWTCSRPACTLCTDVLDRATSPLPYLPALRL